MTMINRDSIVRKNESIITAELEGKAVMMSIENGRYYGFDEIATDIWESLGTALTVSELVSRLTEKYDVTKERCEESVITFLTNLYNENLIEVK